MYQSNSFVHVTVLNAICMHAVMIFARHVLQIVCPSQHTKEPWYHDTKSVHQ